MFGRLLRLCLIMFAPLLGIVGVVKVLASLAPPNPQIVFSARFDGGEALYLYDVPRAQMHRLAVHTAYAVPDAPAWSADRQQLVYLTADPADDDAETVNAYNVSTRQLRIVLPASEGDLILQPPLWSPQADALVFTLQAQGMNNVQLVRLGLPQGDLTQAPLAGAEVQNHALRWLPSDQLRYVEVGETQVRVQDIALAGFDAQTVAEWEVEFIDWWEPVLSPDGERFVVPAVAPGIATYDLFRFDLGSDGYANLTQRTTSNETQPSWSNDGTRIAYKLLTDGQFIMIGSADGGDPTPVYRHPTARISDIRWSPDDTQLSFLINEPRRVELCIIDLATNDVTCPLMGEDIEEVVWR
jgi:Tol biopolymer transport system component